MLHEQLKIKFSEIGPLGSVNLKPWREPMISDLILGFLARVILFSGPLGQLKRPVPGVVPERLNTHFNSRIWRFAPGYFRT